MGLTIPTATATDSFRSHTPRQPLHLPNLPRPHQPTTQTGRPLRRRSSRTHHLHGNPRQNRQRPSSSNSIMPLPNSTRNQHIATLFLPQRHLRLPHPSTRSPSPDPAPILHRNNPPSNSHSLQSPPHPSSPSRPSLASPNRGLAQDPSHPRHHHNHLHHRPSLTRSDSRLPTIHPRLQPRQPRKQNDTHNHEPTQHTTANNIPVHPHRTLRQPALDHLNSSPLHNNSRNRLDENTESQPDRRRPARTSGLAHPAKNRVRPLHRLGHHSLHHARQTRTDDHHNRTPTASRHTRLLVIIARQQSHTDDRHVLRTSPDQLSHPDHRSNRTSLRSKLTEEESYSASSSPTPNNADRAPKHVTALGSSGREICETCFFTLLPAPKVPSVEEDRIRIHLSLHL